MSRWSAALAEVRNARSDQDAHAAFIRACARAFAGTNFKPILFNAWAHVQTLRHSICLELTCESLMATSPIEDMVPRPAGVRDPRFCLRARPRRWRRTPKSRGLV